MGKASMMGCVLKYSAADLAHLRERYQIGDLSAMPN
jgi:hypothetical protein